MAPLIAMLMAKGLPLLANAALVKGSEFLKEKTGIDIGNPGMLGDPEFAKLRQYEMDHEVELAKLKQEDNRIEMEREQMYLKDTDSARNMQIAALSQDDVFSKR